MKCLNEIKMGDGSHKQSNLLEALTLSVLDGWVDYFSGYCDTEISAEKRMEIKRTYNVIIVISDSDILKLKERANCLGYPDNMPDHVYDIEDLWNRNLKGRSKKLLMFCCPFKEEDPCQQLISFERCEWVDIKDSGDVLEAINCGIVINFVRSL